jgi:hypothetical protein
MTENQLTYIEWTTLWMSIRYAMNRETIASSSLPEMIITNYYSRLSDNQKQSIVNEKQYNSIQNFVSFIPFFYCFVKYKYFYIF